MIRLMVPWFEWATTGAMPLYGKLQAKLEYYEYYSTLHLLYLFKINLETLIGADFGIFSNINHIKRFPALFE